MQKKITDLVHDENQLKIASASELIQWLEQFPSATKIHFGIVAGGPLEGCVLMEADHPGTINEVGIVRPLSC